jgi:hypothetical protein
MQDSTEQAQLYIGFLVSREVQFHAGAFDLLHGARVARAPPPANVYSGALLQVIAMDAGTWEFCEISAGSLPWRALLQSRHHVRLRQRPHVEISVRAPVAR